MTGDGIDITDEREYAWLLERTGTLASSMAEVWQSIPIAPGSWWGALLGYPSRFLLLGVTVLLTGSLVLGMVVAVGMTPVALFTLVEGWLPDWLWFTLLGVAGVASAGYLLLAVTAYMQLAVRGEEAATELPAFLAEGIVARPVETGQGWKSEDAVHISHDRSRRRLFASCLLILGLNLQFATVVLGPGWFTGPVDGTWAWVLFFGRSLFDVALLGIPSVVIPPWSALEPSGWPGQLLVVAVDLCFAAGLLTLMVDSFSSQLKPRELFHGTTRDLADFLGDADISEGAALTIHRVAVLRPLDRERVVTLTKAEFLRQVSSPDAPAAPS